MTNADTIDDDADVSEEENEVEPTLYFYSSSSSHSSSSSSNQMKFVRKKNLDHLLILCVSGWRGTYCSTCTSSTDDTILGSVGSVIIEDEDEDEDEDENGTADANTEADAASDVGDGTCC